MTLLLCWAVFPLLLTAVCLGCGLLVERVSGALPGVLLLPIGFAVTIAVGSLATTNGVTAQAATPLVLACALAGFALGRGRGFTIDWWSARSTVAVFLAFAAPIVLSGSATFAGYITLDDTSTFLGLTDRVMDHGRDIGGLAPSTYQRVLEVNLAHGYPVGSFMPLGIGHVIVREDVAWLFQPTIVFATAMLALALYAVVAPAVRSHRARALVVFFAAQPALLYAYSLWTGIKELTAAALIALLAGTAAARQPLPSAIAAAALLDVLGAAGAVWLVPAGVAVAVLVRSRKVAVAAAFGAMLALPAWLTAGDFLRSSNHSVFAGTDLGNLGRPLKFLQLFGIWPARDFRVDPGHRALSYLLIGTAIAMVALGVWFTRRRPGPLVYAATATVGLAVFAGGGSPWIAGKAYAMASPAAALLAATALAVAWERGYGVAAGVVGVLLAGGVMWSNLLAYHGVWLAPRDQLVELERIGHRFSGDGPALMTEYQPYGVRHFLRELDAEGAAELRVRAVYLRDGTTLGKGQYVDLDRFALSSVLEYRTLVLRRSPSGSRPPSVYRLAWRGTYYEVWQRPRRPASIPEHIPLGDELQPGGVPRCADLPPGKLVAVPRAAVAVADFGRFLYPTRAQSFEAGVQVPVAGRYTVWVGGSWRAELAARVDGHPVGHARHVLENTGQYQPFGSLRLAAGTHRVTLRYGGSDAHPGSGGFPFALGPIVFAREDAKRVVSGRAGALCGKRLDWVEVTAEPR